MARKLKVFSVFDSKVSVYGNPFTQRSRGEALRGWMDAVNDRQSTVHNHPEDFTLFEIGEYDPDSGRFENYDTPQSLGVAIEVHKGYDNDSKVAARAVQ